MMQLLAAGTSTVLLSDLLVACGGGGSSNSSSSGTTTVSGKVNTSEIGGTNISISSASADAASISKSGTFSTKVSSGGNQIQFITDGSGKIRGLAMSDPTNSASLSVDSTSTALTLLMLTPGILSTTPSETSLRITQLKALSSFSALQSFLATNLPATALDDLLTQTTLPQLISTCITGWINGSSAAILKNDHMLKVTTDGKFDAAFATYSSAKLTNKSWRFVQVARQPYGVKQQALASASWANTQAKSALFSVGSGCMKGQSLSTWGPLFTDNAGYTDTDANIDLFSPSNQASLEYSVYGIGMAASTETFPMDLSNSHVVAYSLIYYCVFPLLDSVLGLTAFIEFEDLAEVIKEIAEALVGVIKSIADMFATTSNSFDDYIKPIIDLFKAVYGFFIKKGKEWVAEKLGKLLEKAGSSASKFLGKASLVFNVLTSGGNILAALYYWFTLPSVSTVTLPISDLDIIIT